ncbi:MAG: type II toxin-antitoxin system VapC family toxin [Cyanobacteria bacterium K_DeepCast_35m_m2_023]|nr:type II toxin-antitoxin system VapC family toxin [Cyanobacteria bacterium K_DeepCast_35m_m2_023]
MSTICDTHILLFWAHEPERLSGPALQALERGRIQGGLAIADITLWELALLYERGRLVLPADVSADFYLKQLLSALRLQVLPITPEIALLSRSDRFQHGDPADRLIGATALQLGAPLITADAKLRALTELDTVW